MVFSFKDVAENLTKLWNPKFNCFDVAASDDVPFRTHLCNQPADDALMRLLPTS